MPLSIGTCYASVAHFFSRSIFPPLLIAATPNASNEQTKLNTVHLSVNGSSLETAGPLTVDRMECFDVSKYEQVSDCFPGRLYVANIRKRFLHDLVAVLAEA